MSYEYEVCQDCGFPVAHFVRSHWIADDELWLEVFGRPGGILCPPCFALRAEVKGITVSWQAVVEHRDPLASAFDRVKNIMRSHHERGMHPENEHYEQCPLCWERAPEILAVDLWPDTDDQMSKASNQEGSPR